MNPFTAIRLVIGALVVVPFLLFQFGVISYVSAVQDTFDETAELAGEEPTTFAPRGLGGMARALSSRVGGLGMLTREEDQLKAAMDADSYSRRRSVSFQWQLALAEVLEEGETPPAAGMEPLYMTVRAPELALAKCAEILDILARGCLVIDAEAEPAGEGRYDMRARVAYLPTGPLVTTPIPGGARAESFAHSFRGRGGEGLSEAEAHARVALYQRAAMLMCDAIRAKRGNCVLTTLTPHVEPDREGGFVPVLGFRLAYFLQPGEPLLRDADHALLATNPALPILGQFTPPRPRPVKLLSEFTERRRAAEERARREAERLALLEQQAREESEGVQEVIDAPAHTFSQDSRAAAGVKINNGGNALRSGRTIKAGEGNHFRKVGE